MLGLSRQIAADLVEGEVRGVGVGAEPVEPAHRLLRSRSSAIAAASTRVSVVQPKGPQLSTVVDDLLVLDEERLVGDRHDRQRDEEEHHERATAR